MSHAALPRAALPRIFGAPLWSAAALCLAPLAALGAEGLVAPAADWLWPQWQARISVQAAPVVRLDQLSAPAAEATPSARSLQSGALLGDYYFSHSWLKSFRASGGLRLGATTPTWPGAGPGDTLSTMPYVGLGYSGEPLRALGLKGLSLVADLGLVAERPGAADGLSRALLGTQGWESAMRELRLSPVLQLGVRYSF
jgi:hypothetical protein